MPANRTRTKERICLQTLLKDLRLNADLKQTDLAGLLDEAQSFVSKYENGERQLYFLQIRKICQALDLPIEKFVLLYEEKLRNFNPRKH